MSEAQLQKAFEKAVPDFIRATWIIPEDFISEESAPVQTSPKRPEHLSKRAHRRSRGRGGRQRRRSGRRNK